jgi:glyoxylase-like metal-dependent hydrolase (beta-lactamase superfamily II)
MVVAPAPALSLSAAAGGGSLLFRQLFDGDTGTFTYLLADVSSRKGVIIDSVFEQHGRDLSLIRELGIELLASIDTHAHADHVTGSWLMHEATGCAIGLAAAARAENVTRMTSRSPSPGMRCWFAAAAAATSSRAMPTPSGTPSPSNC